jgi:hypothetical protein
MSFDAGAVALAISDVLGPAPGSKRACALAPVKAMESVKTAAGAGVQREKGKRIIAQTFRLQE